VTFAKRSSRSLARRGPRVPAVPARRPVAEKGREAGRYHTTRGESTWPDYEFVPPPTLTFV